MNIKCSCHAAYQYIGMTYEAVATCTLLDLESKLQELGDFYSGPLAGISYVAGLCLCVDVSPWPRQLISRVYHYENLDAE